MTSKSPSLQRQAMLANAQAALVLLLSLAMGACQSESNDEQENDAPNGVDTSSDDTQADDVSDDTQADDVSDDTQADDVSDDTQADDVSDDAPSAALPADFDADLPYAHVVAVSVSGASESYTFAVSVESADIDCSQFTDWWEVLSEEGELLYRRVLLHSHTDDNGTSDPNAPGNTFTRDGGPIAVSSDQTVIVRAHISVGGYNGQAMRGSAGQGFTPAPDIASDFAAEVARQEPLPSTCSF